MHFSFLHTFINLFILKTVAAIVLLTPQSFSNSLMANCNVRQRRPCSNLACSNTAPMIAPSAFALYQEFEDIASRYEQGPDLVPMSDGSGTDAST